MVARPVYVSSGAFLASELEQVMAHAEKAGVTHLELSSSLSFIKDVQESLRTARRQFTLLIHNYFPAPAEPFVLNLAARDPVVLSKSLELCRRALHITAELGAPFYAAHAGFNASPRISELGQPITGGTWEERALAYDVFVESVRELTSLARSLGTCFCIENNVVAKFNAVGQSNPWLLLAEPEEMIAFANTLGDDNFGFLIDVGHLKVSAHVLGFDADQALESLAPWVRGFHLSENDGQTDSNQAFDESAWFLPWLSRFPQAVVVVEAYRLAPEQLESCLSILRNHMVTQA
ncbi:hypothetical protein MTBLM1_40206 [Rhodospirillaceae bacterium LM-1]|nr:hypothetical protein MTBLM1_40206 [Rhodospirillaceae bacterium LM-1]